MLATGKRPAYLEFRSSKRVIGAVAYFAAFTDGFLYCAPVPVLPFSLIERSGVSEEHVTFWITLLLVVCGAAMTIGAPITGWLADLGSRQIPFFSGVIIAIISTLLLCFGTQLWVLAVARVLQGLAASVVYTAGLALIADSVDPKKVGVWLGFVLSGMNLGALIAPLLAGIVYSNAGYYAVFGMILGLLGVDLVLQAFMIEKRTANKWLRDDLRSSTTTLFDPDISREPSTDDLTSSNTPTEEQPREEQQNGTQNEVSEETTPLLKKPPAIITEKHSWFRRKFPRMAILLSSPRMLAAFLGCFTHTTLTACFDTVLPLFVKRTFHWNSTGAGLIFLCITVPTILGPVVGTLSDRYGPRKMALIGFIITTPTLALMGLIKHDRMQDKIGLCVLLTIVGIGCDFILTPLATDMSHEVVNLTNKHPDVFGEAGAYAQAYCFFCSALGAATVVGPLWAGLFYDELGWLATSISMAGLTVLGGIPVIRYTGVSGKSKEERMESSDQV